MTNFDDRLMARFRTLDAAIPTAAAPDLADRPGRPPRAPAATRARSAPRHRASRRGRRLAGRDRRRGRESDLLRRNTRTTAGGGSHGAVSTAQDCLSPADADGRIRGLLASLGYRGWKVSARRACATIRVYRPRSHRTCMRSGSCPGYSHTAAAMVETLQAELLTRCLDRDAAIEFVRTAMASVRLARHRHPRGRSRPGSRTGRRARPRSGARHVAEGCYVLPGIASWDEAGHRTLYLWGQ